MAKKLRIGIGSIRAVLWLVLLTFPITGYCAPPEKGEELNGTEPVNQVVFLYEDGRLTEAEHLALKTLDAPGNLSRQDLSKLYQVLAFCSIANDDEENGKRHFVSALQHNPNLKPDPIGWSPKVRRTFDRARGEWLQITAVAAQREVSIEADICRRAAFRSMLLPGRGQFAKGHEISGWIQGGLFWGSLALTVYANSALPSLRDKYRQAIYPDDIQEKYDDYQLMSRVAIVSGSMTFTIYGYSVFDALWKKPDPSLLPAETP